MCCGGCGQCFVTTPLSNGGIFVSCFSCIINQGFKFCIITDVCKKRISHVPEFIDEVAGKLFDLVNVKVGRFLSEGHTLRRIQYKE